MKKLISLLSVLVVLVLITACSGPRIVCNKPYIRVGTECCLDYNNNAVCDKDESLIKNIESTDVTGSAVEVLNTETEKTVEEENLTTETENLTEDDTSDTEEKDSASESISISNAYWNHMNIETKDSAELNIEFENIGSSDIDEFEYIIKIYKGEKVWKEDTFEHSEKIVSGDSDKVKDIEYTFDEEGTFKAKIFVKDSEQFKESTIYVKDAEEETSDDEEEETETLTCSDTDGGRDMLERGTCKDKTKTYTDTCEREDLLAEYYCEPIDQECHVQIEICNCQSGECVH